MVVQLVFSHRNYIWLLICLFIFFDSRLFRYASMINAYKAGLLCDMFSEYIIVIIIVMHNYTYASWVFGVNRYVSVHGRCDFIVIFNGS
jgi:hypothetical protein